MATYYFMAGLLYIGCLFIDGVRTDSLEKGKSTNRYIAWIYFGVCCVAVWGVAAFRAHMAVDMGAYEREYHAVSKMSWGYILSQGFRISGYNSTEIGFTLFTKLFTVFWDSTIPYFAAISLFSLLPVFCIVKRKSKMPFVSLILFVVIGFYFSAFNTLRSCFVAGLSCLLFDDLLNGKTIKYFLKVAILMCFHTMAFVLFPVYFVLRMKIFRTWKIWAAVLGTGVVMICLPVIFKLFDALLFGGFYSDVYVGNVLEGAAFGTAVLAIAIFFALLWGQRYVCDGLEERIILNGTLLWCCLAFFKLSIGILSRFQDLMSVYPVLCMPLIVHGMVYGKDGNRISERTGQITKLGLATILGTVAVVWLWFILRESPYNPYYTVWSMMER